MRRRPPTDLGDPPRLDRRRRQRPPPRPAPRTPRTSLRDHHPARSLHTGPRPRRRTEPGPVGDHPPRPHSLGLDRTIPLAALAEPCPASGRPIAATLAADRLGPWWADLTQTLTGVLRLFETTGVALEAHGQNLLVAFDGDRPTGLVYRDFGGVRVPPSFAPGLTGDPPCPDWDERARKLIAALFPTTLTALVDALAAWTGTDPGRWWRTLADALAGHGRIGRAALQAPWPIKATTTMRLADRPTDDIWTHIDNPLADA
ncbi:hypothetical protein GCM10029992_44980 [Glycomyces albus]